jgi:rhamnogalacturonyl hydrolase YesR
LYSLLASITTPLFAMKSTFFSGLALAATVVAVTTPRRSDNQTGGITEPYARRMAESWIVNNHETQKDRWYGRAALYTGYEAIIARTGSDELLDWYRSRIDGLVVAEDGTIPTFDKTRYSLDDYRIGNNILYWYERTGEEKYKTAADTIRGMLDRHPRTPTGGFWHRSPTYENQMWLDGIFMADTFYAYWTSLFDADNATAWGENSAEQDAHYSNRHD